MIHVHRTGMRRISRLTFVGDPGFFSFIGGIGRQLLGLPPSSGAGAAPSTAVATVPPFTSGPGGLPFPTRGRDIAATVARGIFPGATSAIAQGRAAFGGMRAAGARRIARGTGRRRRRMNPGNFRALGRALRRLHSFEKRARRVIRITHPHARGRVTFRRPRKRKAA